MSYKNLIKKVISEALTDENKAMVSRWANTPAHVRARTDHYFGKDSDDKFEKLEGTQDKSETHKAVERHLGSEIHPDEYKAGVTRDKYGRQVKIGGLLTKSKAPTDLVNSFANDTTRQGKKFTGLTVHTTRSKEGVAGQTSSNQSWEQESCKNLGGGSNRHYLPHEIKAGTVVSYLKDHTGKELARTTFQPHHADEDGQSNDVVYKVNSEYGIDHAGFKAHNLKTERELTPPAKSENAKNHLYTIHPEVYDDVRDTEALHPDVDHIDIHTMWENARDDADKYRLASVIAKHPSTHIDTLRSIAHGEHSHSNYSRRDAVAHPNYDANTLSDFLNKRPESNSEADMQKYALAHNPNVDSRHVSSAFYSSSHHDDIRYVAAGHPKAPPELLDDILSAPDHSPHPTRVVRAAASNKNVSAETINKIAINLNHPAMKHDPIAVIRNPKISQATLSHYAAMPHKSLGEVGWDIKKGLLMNPSIHPRHLEQMYDSVSGSNGGSRSEIENIKSDLVCHPKASSKMLSTALDDKEAADSVGPHHWMSAILNHPNVSKEHLDNMSKTGDTRVYRSLARLESLQPHHITNMLNSSHNLDADLGTKLIHHPNTTGDHIVDMVKNKTLTDGYDEDSDYSFKKDALTSLKLKSHHLSALLGSPDRHVRINVAQHPHISKEVLEQAMKDPDSSVVSSAMLNSRATDEHRKMLENHPHPDVSSIAKDKEFVDKFRRMHKDMVSRQTVFHE